MTADVSGIKTTNQPTNTGFVSINPYNNEVLQNFEGMSDADVDAAVETASQQFSKWRYTPLSERSTLLLKAAKLWRERAEHLAQTMSREMGALIGYSRDEVEICAQMFEFYAKEGEKLLAPEKLAAADGLEALVHNEPIGPILSIQPWNYPYYQLIRLAAPNLMAGNVVLTKHASNVQQCAEAVARVFKDARFPDGTYTNLRVTIPQVNTLVEEPRVKAVAFTGSNATGEKVAERAGRFAKKTQLELGGSDPCVILEDADMDLTIERVLKGKMHHTGQSCIAIKRIIVVEAVADEFIQRFTEKFSSLQPGDPIDDNTDYGPLYSEKAAINLKDQIDRGVTGGAKITVGGTRDGAFIAPTILLNVEPDNPIYNEELFGPAVMVSIVADEDAAIEQANDNPFGLGASIFTSDLERGRKAARKIDAGMVFVNHPAWSWADMPFGGTKSSGYGRDLGSYGLYEFVNKKLVRVV